MTDFGDTSWPTGRNDYRCEWCGETIPKGEKHAHFYGKWEGEMQNWRMHSECYEQGDAEEMQEGFSPFEHERPVGATLPDPHKEPKS